MITFPNAKINLGLHVLCKREDGFHEIETVFFPVKLHDSLEIMEAEELKFHYHGPGIAGENLVMEAYRLLKAKHNLPPVEIFLLKHIPAGAGLGGGSSDTAHALLMLNEMFQLKISPAELEALAATLGSDCAFFIRNTPAIATGRGEILEDIELDLSAYRIELFHPRIHVSTAQAYGMITPDDSRPSLREIISQPVSAWKNILVNDFEKVVFEKHPTIRAAKEEMYEKGAVYAAMSGSGSSVFGIFLK